MQINVCGQATFFLLTSKEQAGIQFFFYHCTGYPLFYMVWLKMFAGVYFCSLAIFNVLRELIFAN